MKRIHLFFVAIFIMIGIVGCKPTDEGRRLIILQNKPEIKDQLIAFSEKFGEEKDIEVTVKSCGGSACNIGDQLKADFAAGDEPDIFVIDGITGYNEWKDYIAPLNDEPWVNDTDVAFMVNDTVYGFPVAIEGYGMAYNKDLLDQAGIDPTTLTNYSAYKQAFETLDGMKSELGIDAVVSMAAGTNMEWVVRDHNINAYFSNGLEYNDTSIVSSALDGNLANDRFSQYANWVELLFNYAEPTILTTGSYDDQVNAFVNEKTVFIHQGNWIAPNLSEAGATFNRGFAPHGSMTADTDGIFAAAPSWYVVNKNSENIEAAKDFLTYMATTDTGADYMVNQIGAIPAFKSITIKPSAPLSQSVMDYSAEGKIYAWNQYKLPEQFRVSLGPIYGQFAAGQIDKATFIQMMTDQFNNIGDYK